MIEFGEKIVFGSKESSTDLWISFSELVDYFCLILLAVPHFALYFGCWLWQWLWLCRVSGRFLLAHNEKKFHILKLQQLQKCM